MITTQAAQLWFLKRSLFTLLKSEKNGFSFLFFDFTNSRTSRLIPTRARKSESQHYIRQIFPRTALPWSIKQDKINNDVVNQWNYGGKLHQIYSDWCMTNYHHWRTLINDISPKWHNQRKSSSERLLWKVISCNFGIKKNHLGKYY